MRLWAHGSHFPNWCGEDGADGGLLTSPGSEEEKKPGCWARQPSAPSTGTRTTKKRGKRLSAAATVRFTASPCPACAGSLYLHETPEATRSAPLALVPLLTKDARDGHRHASAVSLHAVCPGWRPPGTRPGSSQEGAEAAGAEATRQLSQCVLSCLFYTLLSRMRREMNRVLAVSGRGWGRGRGVRRTFLAEDEDGKPAPSSHSHRTGTLHMPPFLPPLKCSCHLGGARWVRLNAFLLLTGTLSWQGVEKRRGTWTKPTTTEEERGGRAKRTPPKLHSNALHEGLGFVSPG